MFLFILFNARVILVIKIICSPPVYSYFIDQVKVQYMKMWNAEIKYVFILK